VYHFNLTDTYLSGDLGNIGGIGPQIGWVVTALSAQKSYTMPTYSVRRFHFE